MEYYNKGRDGYMPIEQNFEGLISFRCDGYRSEMRADNLHYLIRPEKEFDSITTLTRYQEWAEEAWKVQHGTEDAVERFTEKLLEEAVELIKAYFNLYNNGDKSIDELTSELLSEMGDVLWCVTACASNSGIDIDSEIKRLLHQYTTGVVKRDNNKKIMDMPWREKISEISHKLGNIEIQEIDEAIDLGFEPVPSIAMNLSDDGPEYDINQHIFFAANDAGLLATSIQSLFLPNNKFEDENVKFIRTEESYEKQIAGIGRLCANIYLSLAYISHHLMGLDLKQIVNKNVNKLNARVEANKVDKSDGERPEHLL